MNKQWIVAGIIGVIIVVGVAWWAQGEGYLPDWLPGTDNTIRADIAVRIDEDGYIQGEPVVTLLNVREFFSVGPLWFWRSDLEGNLVAESMRGNALIDRKTVAVFVERSWFGGNEKTFEVSRLRLGEQNSGAVDIRLRVVREDGTIQDTRTIRVTI